MKTRIVACLILLVSLAATADAQLSAEIEDIQVALELSGLTQAGPPRILAGKLLLTYQFGTEATGRRIHTVQAAFAHEEFSTLRSFVRNENGVFLLHIPLPADLETLRYRLVVDGIWTIDPQNQESFTDRWGVALSQFSVPVSRFETERLPVVRNDGSVEFRISAPNAARVSLAGTFNGWDPFMTPLEEVRPGVFSRTLRLPRGEHLYYFAVDGVRLPDPGNEETRWHRNGQMVSVVQLP
jgi:hypothetical protein